VGTKEGAPVRLYRFRRMQGVCHTNECGRKGAGEGSSPRRRHGKASVALQWAENGAGGSLSFSEGVGLLLDLLTREEKRW
jgi:hypothetical protein